MAHLHEQHVAVGASVRRGDVLGLLGNTGGSTGPHLHLGIRVNPYSRSDGWGGNCDPEPYLPDLDKVRSTDVAQPMSSSDASRP